MRRKNEGFGVPARSIFCSVVHASNGHLDARILILVEIYIFLHAEVKVVSKRVVNYF